MTTSDTTFRAATITDLDVLLELMAEFYPLLHIPFDAARARTVLAALLADPSLGRAWTFHAGAAVVGYLALTFGYSLEFGGRVGVVDELYVREGQRRRGLGTAALRLVEAACLADGIRALVLEVGKENAGAQAVYARAGYTGRDNHLLVKLLSGA
jgi:ribosomal protein S18 acetylase RimI-like enzyme